ncbi:MAG: tetratricopeptide repeat protein [Leptolyngbya sp.]|nr:tetratricopeptide repeat protein [Leptolyngbya sp.]
MTSKRNRWLVGTVLTLALAAFLSLSFLPFLSGTLSRRATGNNDLPATDPAAAQAELESQARGYELVLEREPDNQTALRGLIDTQIQLGNVEAVVAPLEKLVELNPTVTEYQVLLAQTKQQLGDLDGAAQLYRTVLDQQPTDMNALQGLTALLVQQGRPQAAIGLLQDAVKTAEQLQGEGSVPGLDPASIQLLLAQVYIEDNRTDQALSLYDEVMTTAPEDFRPVLAKALVLQEQGDNTAAKELFDQAAAMAPDQFKDQIQQMAAQSEPSQPLNADPNAVPSPPDDTDTEASPPENDAP